MESHTITVRYTDGTATTMTVRPGQTILEAAEENGVAIVNECQSGICGTCVATCRSGRYTMGRTEGLSEVERDAGKILTCSTFAESDCLIDLQYPADDNAARVVTGEATVTAVELVSPTTALLRVDVSDLPPLSYQAGQFAQLRVPGTDLWRNYSYAHPADGRRELEFIIRLLPGGVMSEYLRSRAKPGDRIQLRGSKGNFYLRPVVRPVVLVAGGTGLSAILAMAQSLPLDAGHPVHLLYGVTDEADLCKLDDLQRLQQRHPDLRLHTIVARPSERWAGATGLVTDLLDRAMPADGNADVYLCGPAAMVEAVRTWLDDNKIHRVGLYYEKFVSSGAARRRSPARVDPAHIDVDDVRRRGRGTAVVIGGSIAGIATAKMLTEFFDRVIVLEKDDSHRRREGRPGAAQAWHLHHLLTAGRIELERIFPGIIDDMVREGAFDVDMAAQYRIRLGGTWKKPGTGDIQIVCAGRPLLEWCIRRRLDDDPRITFRYEAEVSDLIYDRDTNTVLGAVVDDPAEPEIIPAEFVVDASGKNTPVPEILDRLGVGAPEVEQDIINCFYSTMQHRVPPERRWRDKVMVICYAYRPYEDTYAAQYYTDSSRSILSTTLVAYNCYSPPRTAEEFRRFADLMPSPVVGENIDGLEPASPIYNFRYPNMLRLRYEKKRNLPRGLLAVGDAYTSADPVSGLGMSLALKEVHEMQRLLAQRGPSDPGLPRRYYRRIAKLADTAWFVIREQNLRFDWMKDVTKKRPFYFGVLTWYMDRVIELVHDDPDTYREFLAVVHLVKPPAALMTPRVVAKVLGKWARTRLSGQKTLIERNYQDRTIPGPDHLEHIANQPAEFAASQSR
ncbi:2Fe-2S iron-sulfur cluster binding domain protein [Mycolicibacterium hassiacum DSM 44199]|mgnify:FL=1|uniref:2Fe-2S iron-sulfur cluster binding domain protein n=1 Tax=Mycolicibacterium hassiacum (strain DSM 44199 / CIP 105218 / JCM 12690 / 3849) TaxID=1122247 RepID=K5B973_MYCHD|nr:FAD-binding oxidoreductase [Mycolicibacterium hassiacum]EKF24948.1 2Fe-2S iron-sulfur cluster binding domain protein [Mycolicibacterium hassiacum DSM 44199]MBX5487615.1 2Fe-2S iron-sulfur cluster binding domain-containing protein [Mycolicibacterium hassiacum]VCT88600.1 Anthranilate 1,2-dioxygenase electron transfer component [Mycolicibacterium hassiacum DSM 44199]